MIRVLVVDDDFMVARLHRKLVERVPGFTVVGEAGSGREAVEAIRELRPDLVLLDIYLPDINGLDVLRELRGGDTPQTDVDVLVVTAARDAETVRGALRGGAVHYIIKPFDAPVLRERLEHYARRRHQLAAIGTPGQDDVDRVFGAAEPDAPTPAAAPAPPQPATARAALTTRLPKGVTAQTADLVHRTLLAAADGLSAAECAERSGLSRVSARRYLEFFVSSGRARVTLRYGTAGRPERRYHLTSSTL
ncbi:response regulator [Streptomyces durbertensis]|uniref:Transcriptional regulatory protein n=1 Tax=Streptomyces durbertensis TaxID=2448886 RepID=A0ABR6EDI0_9ACTN|nr:response regulator [Streptomyces durbertensis]MBB1243395.1 response regulator [Streptomyces durbertensis]